jgi:hypothetical protein
LKIAKAKAEGKADRSQIIAILSVSVSIVVALMKLFGY